VSKEFIIFSIVKSVEDGGNGYVFCVVENKHCHVYSASSFLRKEGFRLLSS